MNEHRARVMTN